MNVVKCVCPFWMLFYAPGVAFFGWYVKIKGIMALHESAASKKWVICHCLRSNMQKA